MASTIVIAFRLNEMEIDLLRNRAEIRKFPSLSKTAKSILLDGLYGMHEPDLKLQSLQGQLDKLESEIATLTKIAAMSAAASAIPFEWDHYSKDEVRSRMRQIFIDSSVVASDILEQVRKGKL